MVSAGRFADVAAHSRGLCLFDSPALLTRKGGCRNLGAALVHRRMKADVSKLEKIIRKFRGLTVGVFGDVMLDELLRAARPRVFLPRRPCLSC